jgi:hypothetical protein
LRRLFRTDPAAASLSKRGTDEPRSPADQVHGSGQRDRVKPDRKRPLKNSIRSRSGFELQGGRAPALLCLPASHQRLPGAFISWSAARGVERPLSVGAPQARFIQRHVMMSIFLSSVKKMRAGFGSWLTSAVAGPFRRPGHFLNSVSRPGADIWRRERDCRLAHMSGPSAETSRLRLAIGASLPTAGGGKFGRAWSRILSATPICLLGKTNRAGRASPAQGPAQCVIDTTEVADCAVAGALDDAARSISPVRTSIAQRH